ncbi:MAG: hypothetical protein OXF32_01060 [Anaerolineaceae bacterium]|nr:hypothetical protein [Anaerolineaceae bacterium]
MKIDITRMVSTIAIWLAVAIIIIFVTVFDSGQLDLVAPLFMAGAVGSMVFIWRGYSQENDREQRARAKRNERLAQRLADEEDLDDEDMVSLEDPLEEQRATRRLRDD